MKRELAAGLAMVLVAVVAPGCKEKRRQDPATFGSGSVPTSGFNQPRRGQLFSIGERAEVPELALTVEETKPCQSEHLRKGNVLVGVELSVEGRATQPAHFNPFHCKIRDASGTSFTPTLTGCEPRMRDHRLTQGERRQGWVTFELPATAKELQLVCSQAVAGRQTRTLRFDLPSR